MTNLEAISIKLQEEKDKQLETILKVSGSAVINKNEYGLNVVDNSNVASSLIFKGLNKRKLVDNTYQYLMTKNLKYYIYVNDEDMNIASNIIKHLTTKYDITVSALWDILNEIIPTIYKLDYARCRTMNDQFLKSKNGIWYYQPEFDK